MFLFSHGSYAMVYTEQMFVWREVYMGKIVVDNAEIQVIRFEDEDSISLTDMVRNIENGVALIEK